MCNTDGQVKIIRGAGIKSTNSCLLTAENHQNVDDDDVRVDEKHVRKREREKWSNLYHPHLHLYPHLSFIFFPDSSSGHEPPASSL